MHHPISLIRLFSGDTDPRTPALPVQQQPERHTTGSLARLDSAKRRAIQRELEDDTVKRVAMPKPRGFADDLLTYRRNDETDTSALLFISAAVEAFYRRYGRLPHTATMSSLTLIDFALTSGESNFYYARIGHVRRPVRLSSLAGMDIDAIAVQG
jgi:hypothetical protein